MEKSEIPVKIFGPHGVGDPDDLKLRHVERDVLISRMVSAVAKTKCEEFEKQWLRCQEQNGLRSVFYCRGIGNEFKQCLVNWTHNPDVVQDCTEKYLEARSDFRRTGIHSNKRMPKMNMKSDMSAH